MNKKDLINLINYEILWCEKHPDKTIHKEYQKGFIKGLIQAKYLIVKTRSFQDIEEKKEIK